MSTSNAASINGKTKTWHDGSHLTLEDRIAIQCGIEHGKCKKEIADSLGKDPSTIAKEIRLHRSKHNAMNRMMYPIECANFKHCEKRKQLGTAQCSTDCSQFVRFYCKRRDRTPCACNGCEQWSKCRYQKYRYYASEANRDYVTMLSEARQGEDLTYQEARTLGDVLSAGIKAGQSYYHIKQNHPEIEQSLSTLYRYTRKDTLGLVGVKLIDLRRVMGRKQRRKMSDSVTKQYKQRRDNKHLIGRTYDHFLDYMNQHPNANVVEMDTVYNDVTNGPFMQTFLLRKCQLLISFYHESKTSQEMLDGINLLEQILGADLFRKTVDVILTDRGSEFYLAEQAERALDGSMRTHLFYCDPMASGQKGRLENKHIQLRYVFPKETDLRKLGLTCQKNLNIAVSHIYSYSIDSLNGKSPLAVTHFYFPELYAALHAFGLIEVPPDKVYLKPDLLKHEEAVTAAQNQAADKNT